MSSCWGPGTAVGLDGWLLSALAAGRGWRRGAGGGRGSKHKSGPLWGKLQGWAALGLQGAVRVPAFLQGCSGCSQRGWAWSVDASGSVGPGRYSAGWRTRGASVQGAQTQTSPLGGRKTSKRLKHFFRSQIPSDIIYRIRKKFPLFGVRLDTV